MQADKSMYGTTMLQAFFQIKSLINIKLYTNVYFQKISIPPPPPQKGLEIPGGGGSRIPKNIKKCIKPNWNFQRGVRKNPFHGGGMDISWNYTIQIKL